jgi:hypothetical protein
MGRIPGILVVIMDVKDRIVLWSCVKEAAELPREKG